MGDGNTLPQLLRPQRQSQTSSPTHHQLRRANQLFTTGSSVEVQTDEEDFKGVFFAATVIANPSHSSRKKRGRKKIPRKLHVEYHNLLALEDGSERLTESVDISFVRPAPPPQEVVSGFELDDVVDAYYKDGWWTGVVTRVVQGSERFVVTFSNPPDELEFGLADLRVHWDWVDGSWVRPVKQTVAALMFDAGRKIEVSLDVKDSEAWFPATIHEDLGDGKLLAEYCRATADKHPQMVKITVDSLHVRPCPPLLKDKTFSLLEKVDAYLDFGWWTGIVTKVLEDSKYTVFFQQTKRAEQFHLSDLRPHMEWKDSRWFTSSQDVAIPHVDAEMHEHSIPENGNDNTVARIAKSSGSRRDFSEKRTPRTLAEDQSEHSTPANGKPSDSPMVERKHSFDSSSELSHSSEKLKEGNRPTLQNACDISTSKMPSPVKKKTNSARHAATGDLSSDNPSWGKRIQRRHRKVSAPRNASKNTNAASSSVKKCSAEGLQNERPVSVLEGKDPRNPIENAEIVHLNEDAELHVILGLPCAETGSSGFGTSRAKKGRHSNIKGIIKLVNDQQPLLNEFKDSGKLEVGGSIGKRKRGRPRKIAIESLLTPVKDGDVASHEVIGKGGDANGVPEAAVWTEDTPVQETAITEDKEQSANDKTKSANGRSYPTNRKRHVLTRSTEVQQKHSFKRGRKRARSEKVATLVQESNDASGSNEVQDSSVEVHKVFPEARCSGNDDEPLSKWIEGMHSPSIVDGSRESLVRTVKHFMDKNEKPRETFIPEEDTANQSETERRTCVSVDGISETTKKLIGAILSDEDAEKQPEHEWQSSALADEGSVVQYEQVSLPFVKNTVLWKAVEAMEIFRTTPQRPHFQPLENIKESSREGLAIGYMVTFASVAEKASRLRLNDPKSVTDDMLETLADLERHGFDTRSIHDRISELFAAKEKEGKLLEEVNELKNQILARNHKKSRIKEEISAINEQIRKLQEKLSLAESAIEEENENIAALQARVQETEESIKNVTRDFEVEANSNVSASKGGFLELAES